MNGILQRRERKLFPFYFFLSSHPFLATVYSCTSSNSLEMVDWKSWRSKQFCQSMESSLLSWVRCIVKLWSYRLPRLPYLTNLGQVGCDTVLSRIPMLMNLGSNSFKPQRHACWRHFQRGAATYFSYRRYTKTAKFGGRVQTPQANYWCVPALIESWFEPVYDSMLTLCV